jgi:predicted transcriptional regulator YheO
MKVSDVRIPLAAIAPCEADSDKGTHLHWIEEAVRQASRDIAVLAAAREVDITDDLFENGLYAIQRRLEALAETIGMVSEAERVTRCCVESVEMSEAAQ